VSCQFVEQFPACDSLATILDMGHPRERQLDDYTLAIGSGLTRQADTERRAVLSSERAAGLEEQLRQLQTARQAAESESRNYSVG
jgi:hypothetical protein